MKRKYIVMIMIFSLTFVGCEGNNYANSTMVKNAAVATNQLPTFRESQKDKDQIKPLDNDDFIISYHNVSFTVGEDAGKVLQQLGEGTANENNNFGFVGYDNEYKHKIFMHGYPANSPIITLYSKVSIHDGTSIISQLDITNSGTKRGLSKGDSYSKMIALYGTPNKEAKDSNGTKSSYWFENKELDIYYNSNQEVIQILLVNTDL